MLTEIADETAIATPSLEDLAGLAAAALHYGGTRVLPPDDELLRALVYAKRFGFLPEWAEALIPVRPSRAGWGGDAAVIRKFQAELRHRLEADWGNGRPGNGNGGRWSGNVPWLSYAFTLFF